MQDAEVTCYSYYGALLSEIILYNIYQQQHFAVAIYIRVVSVYSILVVIVK
jgi:hypothetical protein